MTDNKPKCLLYINGVTILERMLSNIQSCGITEVVFVLGYREKQIKEVVTAKFPKLIVNFVTNANYAKTNTGYSLLLAKDFIGNSNFIKFDADVVFDKEILLRLINCDYKNCLCIDKSIQLDHEEIKVILGEGNCVLKISKAEDAKTSSGESIGIEKIDSTLAIQLFKDLEKMMEDKENLQNYYESSYARLIEKNIPFHALDITGLSWVEIDTKTDFINAEKIFRK